jgi:hypothetical protein
MATFVLIHGAGDSGWYWHLVATELRERGHEVVAPDLPADDDAADLWTYADAVVDAIGEPIGVVVVGQSFGAFTAPLICDRVPTELLVFVAGMIPSPRERPDDWWSDTGYEREPRPEGLDDPATFYHDVPPDLASEHVRRGRNHPSPAAGREPWPLPAMPKVPTRSLLFRDDRLFPAPFMRRITTERLGVTADEIDGGHCAALSRPLELADRFERYLEELRPPSRPSASDTGRPDTP